MIALLLKIVAPKVILGSMNMIRLIKKSAPKRSDAIVIYASIVVLLISSDVRTHYRLRPFRTKTLF